MKKIKTRAKSGAAPVGKAKVRRVKNKVNPRGRYA